MNDESIAELGEFTAQARRLLPPMMRDAQTFKSAIAAGLSESSFISNTAELFAFRETRDLYEQLQEAPGFETVRERVRRVHSRELPESMASAEPIAALDVTGIVAFLNRQRELHASEFALFDAMDANKKGDLEKAAQLIVRAHELKRGRVREPTYHVLSDAIGSALRPVGRRFSTGFETLDDAVRGGIPVGRLVILSGPPGASKTGIVVSLMDLAERAGYACLYLAADEPAEGIIVRLGQLAGFERDHLERDGAEGNATRTMFASKSAGRSIVVIDPYSDDAPQTLEDAAAVHMRFAADKPRLLVVDSLQTAMCAAATGLDSPRERMDAKVAVLKNIANSGTLVLAISEMSRAGYRSGDRNQDVSALAASKESGAIEYACSLLLALRVVKDATGQVDVEIAKNRLGSRKPQFRLRLDFDRASFSEIAMPDADEQRENRTDAKREAAIERVREAIRSHTNLKSQNAVLAACKGNRTANHDALRFLEMSGEAAKVAGYYRLHTEREGRHAAE